MLVKLLIAWGLMVLSVAIHAAGLAGAVGWLRRRYGSGPVRQGFWRATWLLGQVAAWVVLLHLAEISVWALFFAWRGALPDVASAFYFSIVTFTTTGYGDLVLPEAWRLLGGVEALTGIMLCGWSTAFFFAIFMRVNDYRPDVAGLADRD